MEQTLERTAVLDKPVSRNVSLDLVRAFAGLSVLSVHFFLNCGFYQEPMQGKGMLVMTIVRMGFMVCVPLFLMLSGWLCGSKTLSKRYYLGIIKVYLTYALATLACNLFRWVILHEPVSLKAALKGLLNFSGAPYAWYIEMYLGLFLLIPFINLVYRGLETQRKKLAMVVTLLALTTLPCLTNLYGSLLPDWWANFYPLTYYVMGLYFREYTPRWNWKWLVIGFLSAAVVGGGYAYARNLGNVFTWSAYVGWAGPTVVLSTLCVFLLLLRIPVNGAPRWVKWLLKKGSELSLGIYLVSWCFDQLYYPILAAHVPKVTHRLFFAPVIVLAVYLSSALVAQVLEWARKGIVWCINKAVPQAKLK